LQDANNRWVYVVENERTQVPVGENLKAEGAGRVNINETGSLQEISAMY
jgi:hypothetical protein